MWGKAATFIAVATAIAGAATYLAHMEAAVHETRRAHQDFEAAAEPYHEDVKSLKDIQIQQEAGRAKLEELCNVGMADRVACAVWGLEWKPPPE